MARRSAYSGHCRGEYEKACSELEFIAASRGTRTTILKEKPKFLGLQFTPLRVTIYLGQQIRFSAAFDK